MSFTALNGKRLARTYVVDLDRESREARRVVRHWHTICHIMHLESVSLHEREENTHNPEANPTCPLVLVVASFWHGAAKLDCVTVWFFWWNSNVTVCPG